MPQTRGNDLLIKCRNLQLSQAINTRKETNNQAILISTVVTVIFLKLSFVTSCLAMKSIDIRNGNFEQALFWELSVTLAVIAMAAIWFIVRFKHNLRRKLNGLLRRLSLMFGRRQQRVSF
jgi:Mg2+ and Co2+ transporter CorA